jgi:hypothetical protein
MRAASARASIPTAMATWAMRAVVAAACAATVAFALVTLATRPLDGTEGSLLFDAARIRDRLPLYVDPLQGAWSYGPVPSRYYVLHTPLWAAVLSLLPAGDAAPLARALAIGAWLGLLAGIALGARPGNRGVAWPGALFLAGAYPLTLFAAAGRHDAPALLLAGVALLRSMRRGRAGALEGGLFALAAFLKPNVVGAAAGVVACTLWHDGRRSAPVLAGLASVTAACVLGLHVASDGAWLEHLVASTQTTPALGLWLEQMASRLPFFGLPLAAAFGVAWRARDTSAGRIGLWALAASTAWTCVSLAKVGSASNYWMEPCVVALAIAALAPLPALHGGPAVVASVAALAQALWVGVAAVRSSLDGLATAPRRAAVLAGVRQACGAGPQDVVLADEPGLEMTLDGRVVQMPFVMTHLVRAGRYPLAPWQADVQRGPVRCLVMQTDLLERPPEQVHPVADLFDPPMRATLRERFALVQAKDSLWVYAARRP